MQDLGADFLVFSAHKLLGPNGVGVLWSKMDILEQFKPFIGGGDMISKVTFENASWNELKPMVISHLNHYFENNKEPILKNELENSKIENESNETIQKIKEVLDTKIRPAVARDGGDIKFKSFENGVVKVELQGSCSGCPSSLMTLKQGVQNLLKHYVKEVNTVEAI